MHRKNTPEAIAAHREAKRALRANQRAEIAAGITKETDTFVELNDRVLETEQHVSWWRR